MSENEKPVPYITRLEKQRDVCIAALKSVDAYHSLLERERTCAYKYDAKRQSEEALATMRAAISEAKNLLGGLYA